MIEKKKILSFIGIIILYLLSIPFSISKKLNLSLLINLIATLLAMRFIKKVTLTYTNLISIFFVFSFMYGVSGPINVLWGDGLHPIYGNFFNVGAFLLAYSLSNIGFLFGIIFFEFSHFKNYDSENKKNVYYLNKNKNNILNNSLIIAFLLFISEITNYFRVGGFSVILMGKAIYQSKITELSLTIPTDNFMYILIVLLSLYLAISKYQKSKINKKKFLLIIILMMPYIMISLFLGQRGKLLSMALILVVGTTFIRPLKKIKFKFVLYLILGYIFMAFLFANRPILPTIFTDFDFFISNAFNKEKLISALNPGGSEFDASFGNFNKFYVTTGGNFPFLLGKSYMISILSPIPSFIYPGKKPLQITYLFRNVFFPSEIKRGAIAGTAFSSILEAYWNFGFIGIILMYFIFAYILMYLDRKLKYKSFTSLIFYLSIIPNMSHFHRSSLGGTIGNVVINSMIIFIFVYLYKELFYTNIQKNNTLL